MKHAVWLLVIPLAIIADIFHFKAEQRLSDSNAKIKVYSFKDEMKSVCYLVYESVSTDNHKQVIGIENIDCKNKTGEIK